MSKQCLKLLAVLLCGLLLISVPACKPETVTYPSVITDPGADTSTEVDPSAGETPEGETPKEETPKEETSEGETSEEETSEGETSEGETPKEETPDGETPKEETPTDTEADTKPEEGTEQEAEPLPFAEHPFAAEGFKPSAEVASSLTAGVIKKGDTALLKDRTLTLYTAGSTPSFYYKNAEGVLVSEWDWMKAMAEELGCTLKLVRKTDATSLKAQRIALYAGQELSLVTLRKQELASGLALCRSAKGYLNKATATQGISAAVLKQSNNTLFAPIGNAEALWYNKAQMPNNVDPHTLYQNDQWTTELYTAVHFNAVEKKVMPLQMESALPWATLSGKSPLTLLKGKLDSNLNAKVTQAVWEELRTLNENLTTFMPAADTVYSLKDKNVAMAYTAIPAADGNSYSYAPLPTFKAGEKGTVTYCGTFMALPKYRIDSSADLVTLTFAELWCNRYAEAIAANLQALGIAGEGYREYLAMTESQGSLILYDAAIESLAADYLKGLTDPEVKMSAEYEKIRNRLLGMVAKYNLNY